MKKKFSTNWNSSKSVAKQRKYRFNAPAHLKHKLLACHLSKDLKAKYNTRSVVVRTGDKVKVMIGQHKGRENKVERVDPSKERVYITGIDRAKKDGSRSLIPLRASNLIITDLDLDDKKRKAKLEGTKKLASKKAEPKTVEPKKEKPADVPADKKE